MCFQVNQDNVVKVGHRQVVNMIRLGGNRLLIKVVTVSRNLDPDDTARKKGTPGGRGLINGEELQTGSRTMEEEPAAGVVRQYGTIPVMLVLCNMGLKFWSGSRYRPKDSLLLLDSTFIHSFLFPEA